MDTQKSFFAHRVGRGIKWVVIVLLALYVVMVIVRTLQMSEADRTAAQVAKIHSTKISMADVTGENLPPEPGGEADKTLAGVDANKNGIRDDVELAIFEAYPDSAKTRAVLLQYALALQMEFAQPFMNTTIATEIVREQSRGFQCVGNIISNPEATNSLERLDTLIQFVKNEQYNSENRTNYRNDFLKRVRSYSDLGTICDIDLETLPN